MSIELKSAIDQITTLQKQSVAEQKAALSKLTDEQSEFAQRLFTLEQRGTGGSAPLERKAADPLAEITKHPTYAEIRDGSRGKFETKLPLSIKALSSLQAGPPTDDRINVQADRHDGIHGIAQRKLGLFDVLPKIPTSSNRVEYIQASAGFTFAAAYQLLEGAEKAEQSLPTTTAIASIVTIASFLRASRQVLSDHRSLERSVSQLLSFGALSKLEAEVISGAGGAGQITGLATAAATVAGATGPQVDRISFAEATLSSAGWQPDLVILNPVDWHEIRSERGGDGQYAAGGWSAPARPNIWSLNVVVSPSLAINTALVLDSSQVAILDRESVSVMTSTEDGSNFTTNRVTILAELRAGLAIFSPTAVGKVTLA